MVSTSRCHKQFRSPPYFTMISQYDRSIVVNIQSMWPKCCTSHGLNLLIPRSDITALIFLSICMPNDEFCVIKWAMAVPRCSWWWGHSAEQEVSSCANNPCLLLYWRRWTASSSGCWVFFQGALPGNHAEIHVALVLPQYMSTRFDDDSATYLWPSTSRSYRCMLQ